MRRLAGSRLLAVLAAALIGCAGQAAGTTGRDDAAMGKLAGSVNTAGLLFRVGLDVGHRLMLSSDRPYTLVDPSRGGAVWKDGYTGETALIAEGGPEGEPVSVFRIQVGAFATAEAAEAERASLAKLFGVEAVARFVPDRGSWRVRVGACPCVCCLKFTLRSAQHQGHPVQDPCGQSAQLRSGTAVDPSLSRSSLTHPCTKAQRGASEDQPHGPSPGPPH